MPYKDKEARTEAVKRYRERQGGITEGRDNIEGLQYPAIVQALVDPVRRNKLERIHQRLNVRGLLKEVRYGIYGPTFDIVGELLEITG